MKTILAIFFIVAGAGIIWGVAFPLWSNADGTGTFGRGIKELRVERSGLKDAERGVKDALELRDKLLARYRDIPAEDLKRLGNMIPEGSGRERMMLMLNNLSGQYGMSPAGLSFNTSAKAYTDTSSSAPGVSKIDYAALSMSFGVEGSYDTIRAFFKDLEKSLQLIDIESVQFTAGDEDSYSVSLTAKSYYIDSPRLGKSVNNQGI